MQQQAQYGIRHDTHACSPFEHRTAAPLLSDLLPRRHERHAHSGARVEFAAFPAVLICLFASAGQLAIDIYVPALPDMARSFATTPQAIQSSVSGYMAAYALGQLIFGPVADAYGRKRVLAFKP